MAAISRGIDVSDFQGAQDWKALVEGGLTFAMVKATEGEHTHFDHYAMHMSGMLAAGVLPGAYHYAWPNHDARAEADNYIGAVRKDADAHAGFTHWLDQERRTDGKNYAGVNAAQIRAYATAWVARVKAAFPHQRVGVYTAGSDISAAHYPANSDALWYPAYPAGAMSYTQAEQRSRPAPGGVKALFWQFTSTPIDRSICYMTPAQLRTWAGAEEDDMPLNDADKKWIQATITAAVAGAFKADVVPAARPPYANADYAPAKGKTPNTTWTGAYALQTGVEAGRQTLTIVQKQAAQTAALTAAVAELGKGGGITAEQIQAAAEAGATAALAELGDALKAPAPADA